MTFLFFYASLRRREENFFHFFVVFSFFIDIVFNKCEKKYLFCLLFFQTKKKHNTSVDPVPYIQKKEKYQINQEYLNKFFKVDVQKFISV